MQLSNSLRATLVALGLGFILLGLWLNLNLYTSLAPDGETLYKGSYGLVGILLDLSKVTLLVLGTTLIIKGFHLFGILSLVTYVILSGISFSAGWGFSLVVTDTYEKQQAKSSFEYANYQTQLENANAQKSQLAHLATLDANSLQAEIAALENNLNTEQQALNNCPSNYITHCITPAKQRIANINAELKKANDTLNGYTLYVSASNTASEALNNIANLDSGNMVINSNAHPLFIGMGKMFNTSAESAKYTFTFISFLMVELLGAFLYMAGLVTNDKKHYSLEEIEQLETALIEQQQRLAKLFNRHQAPALEGHTEKKSVAAY